MARPLRIQFPGGLYHVTTRGNGRQPIFADDSDRERFLVVLSGVVARHRLLCHAYCLMGNHYHLLLETPEANLSRAMQQLNGVYSKRFSRRHQRPGHVLEGRFHARIVDRDAYLQEVCRYIVLNPVRAGLVARPDEWPWSSYRATVGEVPVPAFLTVEWVLSLGRSRRRVEAERQYRRFVRSGMRSADSSSEPAQSLLMGGPEAFAHLRERITSAAADLEIPRAQRFALRSPLAELFAGATSRHARDARCVLAVRDHGYAMREIAEFLGVHYATVSRALVRGDGTRAREEMLDCKT